ncbi:hypothetical protein [Hydrogenoanaerobacterium sp.]|uniref:hypothetical protein n=1 Tax=Hydrogenoanaerobacterium sp. TaxID=2953763 RepID=UPI002898E412|nr:hypothetical protein [Hydrogenoanaerobacterium sp.]
MREKYWAMYEELVTSKYYYWHYRATSTLIDNIVNGVLCVASAVSISSWLIWNKLPWLWACIISISQVIGAVRHLFPFSRQISAVNLLNPELDLLINEVDYDWDRVDNLSDGEISRLTFEYQEQFIMLENKYIGSAYFPRNHRCETKAVSDRKAYFFQHYQVTESNTLEVSK